MDIQNIWERLKSKVNADNLMKPRTCLLSEIGRPRIPEYHDFIPMDHGFVLKINIDKPGYLLVLEREPSGAIWCWCPSEWVPEFYFETGEFTFPLEDISPYRTFEPCEVGKEELLAIVTPEKLPLTWLDTNKQVALELEDRKLNELSIFLESGLDYQMFLSSYLVVPTKQDFYDMYSVRNRIANQSL